jgi:hypothetical protein
MAEDSKPNSFWTTIPGILTGVAAVITALTGLLALYRLNEPKSPDAGPRAQESRSGTAGSIASQSSAEWAGASTHSVGETNLLDPSEGARLISFTDPDFQQNLVPNGHGVVGGTQPAEAVYGFAEGRAVLFDRFRMLIAFVSPSNVREFELLASMEGSAGPYQSLGKFQTKNVLSGDRFQEFRLRETKAKYLKVKLLNNHNGFEIPLEFGEFQLVGRLCSASC